MNDLFKRAVRRLEALSTGTKMLVILAVGMLPLGLFAIWATVSNAQGNLRQGEMAGRTVLAVSAQRLTSALERAGLTMRAASDALEDGANAEVICRRTLTRLQRLLADDVRLTLYGAGQQRCTNIGAFDLPTQVTQSFGEGLSLRVLPDGSAMHMVLYGDGGRVEGVAVFGRDALLRIAVDAGVPIGADLTLEAGGETIVLYQGFTPSTWSREVVVETPLLGEAATLRVRTIAMPLNAKQFATILLPVLMWLAAGIIVWFIVNRLLLRPLVEMQRVVARYQPGDAQVDLPSVRSPATEISSLGRAFMDVTGTVSRHERELEAAVERQTKLVREVHHRVKNNLQVVASLLNLHARGAKSEDVAAAYASIQRRVDALAVVHRNHFAELEVNRGIALRSLISELAANLRGNAPPAAAGMQVRIDIDPFHVTQDTAVSVAFFVTEVVEFGMLCGARQVSIAVDEAEAGFARLTIESDSLAGELSCDQTLFERFDRIVTGLSRQLRSTLDRDPTRGSYSVRIQVLARDED